MSTGTAEKPTAITTEKPVTYVPLGETAEITLTLGMVKKFLCVPTKSGKMPNDEQVIKFMMLCKAQSLNPWTSDGFCVGYDGQDGPQFSLITAHQAFLKRAEASPEFDGIESGVVVAKADGSIEQRQGDLLLNGEVLVGGWARVHRCDRKIPSFDALNLSVFSTGRSRWKVDPAGMIVKCAEASALRKAFPSTLAAMYCKEEMDRARELHQDQPATDSRPKTDRLAARLGLQEAPTMPVTNEIMTDDAHREVVPTHQRETVHEMPEALEREPERVPVDDAPIFSPAVMEILEAIPKTKTLHGLGMQRDRWLKIQGENLDAQETVEAQIRAKAEELEKK